MEPRDGALLEIYLPCKRQEVILYGGRTYYYNISTLRLTPFPCEMVENDDGASSFTADQKFEMEMAKIHLEEVKAEAKVKVAEAMIAKFEERKASNTGFEYNTHSLTPRLYLTFCIKLDFFPLFCASSYTSQYFKIFGL